MDLKEVVARLEIQQVLFRYARGGCDHLIWPHLGPF